MRTIDIYGDNKFEQYTKERVACRGIVIKHDKILLTYEVNSDQWFIPGGGLEKDESFQECCVRELAEETGCVVNAKKKFLTINEYYEEWHFVSHYFICDYLGETERALTKREIEAGLEPRWIPLSEAIDIFSKHQDYAAENEMKRGAYLREYKALLNYVDVERIFMQVQLGQQKDIDEWMKLVGEMSWNFPGLETSEGMNNHRETVLRFMSKKQALCVRNETEVMGVLLFSRGHNMICCLGVSPKYRRCGIASMLLSKALEQLDRTKDITVSTFREGDKKGVAPRALYKKFGFVEDELIEEFGYPNQKFVLHP